VTSVADDALMEIRNALSCGAWVPSPEEKAFGSALLFRHGRLQQEPDPADMPAITAEDPQRPWLTQGLSLYTRLAQEVTSELLPLWRRPLADSPMLSLVIAYVDALWPMTPFAARMLTAWTFSPPAPPSWPDVQRTADQYCVSPREAERRLRRAAAVRWEESQLSVEEWDEIGRLNDRAKAVGTLLGAAVAGDSPEP
jgi:hypothetical protein